MSAWVDETHDPLLRSWVAGADGHGEFPIQNLPLGMFSPPGEEPRAGVAIGDYVFDLSKAAAAGLVDAGICPAGSLDRLLGAGAGVRRELRRVVSGLLARGAPERPELLHRAAECVLHLPTTPGNYTDFYAGIHHATNVGKLFRPEAPLLPNYKYVPIGYHGRASSVRPSGVSVVRPTGQTRPVGDGPPGFGPTRALDFELELGMWVGPGNALGSPIAIGEAGDHIAGYCLLNDWSARDVQAWEYQPLGPFLGKSFHTTVSPWVVTPEALAPFRRAQGARPAGDPAPLPYLLDAGDQAAGALELSLEVFLLTPAMRKRGEAPFQITATEAEELYWTPAQMVAHHASNGCNLLAGDLLGTGTISGGAGVGSLLEMTLGGARAVSLPGGEERTYLLDGDEVWLRGTARRAGFVSIGFGECRGRVVG